MRIAFIAPENWLLEIAGALYNIGYDIRINQIDEGCDIIILWSVTRMQEMEELRKKYEIPFIIYNWDTYYWQHERPRENEYDWKHYGGLLRQAIQVWCPSECTRRAMGEIYGVKGIILPTYAPLHHLKGIEVSDKRYVLHAMREYPDDFDPMLDKACKELEIKLVRTRNLMSLEEYRKAIAECSLIVSHYKEASTGGLSLVEAVFLGKSCLISDSSYNGGKEYIGDYGVYFEYGNYEDLKEKIANLYTNPILREKPKMRTLTDMVWDIDVQLKRL